MGKLSTIEVTRLLQIAHHPMAQNGLITDETKESLVQDPMNRVKLYKAPIFLACSVITQHNSDELALESIRARSLLNKVAGFERATPTDLNIVLNQVLRLAITRDEDVAEIGSHFYSRMMKKISREEEHR